MTYYDLIITKFISLKANYLKSSRIPQKNITQLNAEKALNIVAVPDYY